MPGAVRRCRTCKDEKPLTAFSSSRAWRCDACKANPPKRRYVEPARACYHCHETKPADAFAWADGSQGQGIARCRLRVCLDCHAREAAEREQNRAARTSTWIAGNGKPVRRCSRCGKVKDLKRGFHANGPDRRLYRCKPCQIAYVREVEQRRRQDPEWRARRLQKRAVYNRRARAEKPDTYAEYDRRFRERLKADPIRHARALETERIARRLRMEREQGAPLPSTVRSRPLGPVRPDRMPILPAFPLAVAIESRISEIDLNRYGDGGAQAIICERAGVDARQLRAWRTGEIAEVHFATVDRVLVGLELLWWEVYTPDIGAGAYEQARRAFEPEEIAA